MRMRTILSTIITISSAVAVPTVIAAGVSFPQVAEAQLAISARTLEWTLPTRTDLGKVVLSASDYLQLAEGVTVVSAAGSTVTAGEGGVGVGDGSSAPTILTSGGVNLVRAHVAGDVLAGSGVTARESTVTGETRGDFWNDFSGSATQLIELPKTSLGARTVGQKVTLDLSPGRYDRVVVSAKGKLVLRAGRYFFTSLKSALNSQIVADTSAGPIEVYVTHGVNHNGRWTGDPANTLLVYFGASLALISGQFQGTVFAPNASLELDGSSGIPMVGSFFARDLFVGTGTRVEHVPCTALQALIGTNQVRTGAFIPRQAPAGVSSIPGYDPGVSACDPFLKLGGLGVDASGIPAYESIGLATSSCGVGPSGQLLCSLPPNDVCSSPTSPKWCDPAGNPIAGYDVSRLNLPPPSGATCPAVGVYNGSCAINPATVNKPCTATSECSSGELCGLLCVDAACTKTEKRCGRLYESCGGLPAESACEEVPSQCPDPRAIGAVAAAEVQQGLPSIRTPLPSASVTPLALTPFRTAAACPLRGEGQLPATKAEQGAVAHTAEGNDQWGAFIDPVLKQENNIFEWDTAFGDSKYYVHGLAGLDVGAIIMGNRVTALSASMEAQNQACGTQFAADLKLFGDAIVTYDPANGLQGGWRKLGIQDPELPTFESCDSDFKAKRDKAGELRQAYFLARDVKDYYLKHGNTIALCEATNSKLGTDFDCFAVSITDISIVNAWAENYQRKTREFLDLQTKVSVSTKKLALSGSLQLLSFDERFSVAAAEQFIPLGPITLTVAAEAFGTWSLGGSIEGGVVLGQDQALVGVPNAPPFPADTHLRAAAGALVTPGISFSVVAYAGVGLPGVSVGIEGEVEIVSASLPAHAMAGLWRRPLTDPRDRAGSGFFGNLVGIPTDPYQWGTTWNYGAKLNMGLLNGRISLAARIRLLFFKKTFRHELARWNGVNLEAVLAGDQAGVPLAGGTDFGSPADDIAYVEVPKLATAATLTAPDRNFSATELFNPGCLPPGPIIR